jgi:putative tryptophan/tyrosine transport system substrate-binding protein
MFAKHRARIADLAARSRLPAIYPLSDYADAGGLMSYGPNINDLYRRVAYYLDRILKKGAKPADLPVETPTKFELVINLKTAKQIGVTIPDSVLYRVDRVIK